VPRKGVWGEEPPANTTMRSTFRISYGAAQRQALGAYPDDRTPTVVARVREREGEETLRERAVFYNLELGPIVTSGGCVSAYGYPIKQQGD